MSNRRHDLLSYDSVLFACQNLSSFITNTNTNIHVVLLNVAEDMTTTAKTSNDILTFISFLFHFLLRFVYIVVVVQQCILQNNS